MLRIIYDFELDKMLKEKTKKRKSNYVWRRKGKHRRKSKEDQES
jgi:hypothetical protein